MLQRYFICLAVLLLVTLANRPVNPADIPPPGSSIRRVPRIVGQVEALEGWWPWQVMLHSPHFGGFSCTGSRINEQWVLTAADCFPIITAGDVRMFIGNKRAEIMEIIKHPQNSSDDRKHIALVRVKVVEEVGRNTVDPCRHCYPHLPIGNIGEPVCHFMITKEYLAERAIEYDSKRKTITMSLSKEGCRTYIDVMNDTAVVCADKNYKDICSKVLPGSPMVCRSNYTNYLAGIAIDTPDTCTHDPFVIDYIEVNAYDLWIRDVVGHFSAGTCDAETIIKQRCFER